MANTIDFILTNAASEIISKVLSGKTLNFTRMAVGDGFSYDTTAAKNYTALVNEVLSLDITKSETLSASSVKITSAFKNTDAQKEFYYREVGLFAQDPDTGEEVLYAYGNRNDAAELITPTGLSVVTKQLAFIISVGDSAKVTFNVNAGVYALQEDVTTLQTTVHELDRTKANQTYVDTKIGTMTGNGTFKGSMTNEQILALTDMTSDDIYWDTTNNTYMRYNGTSWASVGQQAFGNKSISNDNLVDWTIGVEKTNFIEVCDNIFDKNNVIEGSYCTALGNFGDNSSYYRSGYIVLDSSKTSIYTNYCTNTSTLKNTLRRVRYITFFNSEKVYISGFENENTAIIPDGARYVMFTSPYISTGDGVSYEDKLWHISYDNIVSTYAEYSIKLKNAKTTEYAKIDDNIIAYDKTFSSYKINSIIPTKTKRIIDITSQLVFDGGTKQIKFIGDSITHGAGGTGFAQDGDEILTYNGTTWKVNTSGYCWANLLKSYINDKFGCEVKNYGCSGITAYRVSLQVDQLIEAEDDIIVVMLGTNDRSNTSTLTSLKQSIVNIYNAIISNGSECILMSPIPASVENEIKESVTRYYHMEDIDNLYMQIACELNIEYISMFKLLTNYCTMRGISLDSILSDGLHPNDEGYDIMFNLICMALGFAPKTSGATW